MSVDAGLLAWLKEELAPLGTITHRGMMGGATLYCDGVVFAVIDDDRLWLKCDARSDAEWDAAGCERFSFARKDGTTATMNYRAAPDDCYDDGDALRRWASLGLAAGARAPRRKRRG